MKVKYKYFSIQGAFEIFTPVFIKDGAICMPVGSKACKQAI
jgi:hypothetical protein